MRKDSWSGKGRFCAPDVEPASRRPSVSSVENARDVISPGLSCRLAYGVDGGPPGEVHASGIRAAPGGLPEGDRHLVDRPRELEWRGIGRVYRRTTVLADV